MRDFKTLQSDSTRNSSRFFGEETLALLWKCRWYVACVLFVLLLLLLAPEYAVPQDLQQWNGQHENDLQYHNEWETLEFSEFNPSPVPLPPQPLQSASAVPPYIPPSEEHVPQEAPSSRWGIPRRYLPNIPSVQNLLPNRTEPKPEPEPSQIGLPGFQGRKSNARNSRSYFSDVNKKYTSRSGSGESLLVPSPQSHSVPSLHSPYMSDLTAPEDPGDFDVESMIADYSGDTTLYYPKQNATLPITILAKSGWSKQYEDLEIYFLTGNCSVQQGKDTVEGARAVLWVDRKASPQTVHVYMESDNASTPLIVELNQGKQDARILDQKWCGAFATSTKIDVNLEKPAIPQERYPEIYARAEEMRFPGKVKFSSRQLLESEDREKTSPLKKADFRAIQFIPRSDTLTEINYRNEGNRSIGTITNGFTVVINGIVLDSSGKSLLTGDAIDITADRAVIWTENLANLSSRSDIRQATDMDLEIYLEGNICFREGMRTIYAKKMYYDVKNRVGYILDAEFLEPAPGYEGLIRMKTAVLQQTGANKFLAKNAYVTTSRLGEPTYRVQSNLMTFEEISQPLYDSQTGVPLRDPVTGNPQVKKRQLLVAENNVVCLGPVPILYWPWMAADLQYRDPFMYIRSINFGHDGTFGTQVRTTWNPYQIFNIKNQPEGTSWDISLDYLSKRGLGHGTNFTYSRGDFFGCTTPCAGLFDFWGIYDKGTDKLGYDRRHLEPEESYRYRVLWRHRQSLGSDWTLSAEIGKSSDRNFMPQYFEREWDELKNQSTDIELKRTINNHSFSVFAAYRFDDFVTETNWLRADHHWMGQSFLEDTFTWYEHTKLGVADFKTASYPENANTTEEYNENYFQYLPWEIDPRTGESLSIGREVFSTKHEVDMPLSLGAVRVVPYVLGELAHWGEDYYGDSTQRAYYQLGVRANLPMWKLMPNFQSRTWYANGLAHKVDFEGEFFHAGSNVNWDSVPMYDSLDDDSVEQFRRRYTMTTFNGAVPVQFDERYYAIRSGIASNVSSPVDLADDLTVMRFGIKNRWQTKRGPLGSYRIIDWITFDTHLNIYPKKEQNFGETLGLVDYNFRWHIGDRFALLSSGIYDFFSDGQKITRIGAISERPGRGSIYLGVDRLDGPFESTYINLNIDYQMNEKYSMKFGTSYDLSEGKSAGQSLRLTRTGESFAISMGMSMNQSTDSFGVNFSIQPVFLTAYRGRAR